MTQFRVLTPSDPLARAVEFLLEGAQHDFPVVERGSVVGLLCRERVFESLARSGEWSSVSAAMVPIPVVDVTERLAVALDELQESEGTAVAVTARGQLVGLLTREQLGEFVMLRRAVREYARAASPA